MKTLASGVAAAALFAGVTTAADVRAETASGAVLTSTCFSCHGDNGHSQGDMPTIAGKSKSFIVGRLQAYKSGDLQSTVMGRISKGFTDTEIEELASFFADQ